MIKSPIGNRGTYDTTKDDLSMAKGGSVMGINVASDRKAGIHYADLIVDGKKTIETRNSDTLRPYVGKRVAIVRTGAGPAKAIGEVTIGEPMVANKSKFRAMQSKHMVPEGSMYDITTPTKHLYPLHNPVRYDDERDVGHGIVSRKVIHEAKGGSTHEIKATVKLGDRDLPITMDPWDKRAGRQIVHVNPKAFDKAFSKSSWQYVGPKGEGGIEGRYQKFADFAKDAPSVHASNADVNKEGGITFGDGRHRYAYLRDQGVQSIPISMDKQSIQHARRHGYLHEAKGGRVTHAHHLEIEERPL
jgi:hypothetical protein